MNQVELCEILKDKYQSNKENTRIFLNGEWGIGKSHTWKLFTDYQESLGDNKLKLIYISLFGIDTIDHLNRKLKISYLSALDSKASNFTWLENTKSGKILSQFSSNLLKKYTGGTVDIISVLEPEWNNTFVVCFDDLERKSDKIKLNDLMGTIEQIGIHANILLIGCEEKLGIDERSKFKNEKEKIIDYEYHLNKISEQTKKDQVSVLDKLSIEEQQVLIDFFDKHGGNNLRTLKKIIRLIGELLHKTKLNKDLIELCAAVVVSNYKSSHEEKETKKTSDDPSYVHLLKSNLYNLPFGVSSLWIQIEQYLKYNNININLIESYMNPIYEPSKLLMDGIIHYDFYDVPTLEANIEKLMNKLIRNEVNYFLSVEQVIGFVAWVKFLSLEFNLSINIDGIDGYAHEIISQLIHKEDKMLMFRLKHDGFYVRSEFKLLISDLINKTNILINKNNADLENLKFKDSFVSGSYDSCLKILSIYPHFAIDNAYIFDDLIDNCNIYYYSFLDELIRNISNLRLKRRVKVILLKMHKNEMDSIKKRRIKNLINLT
ncbi:hypothetical protein [Paenibacillus agricola]|uniref:KAP-like P-loop domain-containing protein n=1 Tax=Paenibacillus agricola TaxID=2716264 RepID=A0ABX0JHH5_9BACL|nr:hypothetical protein [Paenibacillus agricola]NHN34711.1 hypothetical protein [Paenibacillus agricola]